MGRKTFESMGNKPLPNRKNLIFSSSVEGVVQISDDAMMCNASSELDTSCELFKTFENWTSEREIYIIGGKSLYDYFISSIDGYGVNEIYQTLVIDDSKENDTAFNLEPWIDDYVLESSELKYDEKENVYYQFKKYIRRTL